MSMRGMDRLRIGTAGIPISTPGRGTLDGVYHVRRLGLDAMEMEFVRGVRMKRDMAESVGRAAREVDVALTAHGPYFINLTSDDPKKREASAVRILSTARVAWYAGGYSITFHAAYYGRMDHAGVYRTVRDALQSITDTLRDDGITIWVRPELTGKATQFGDLEELLSLSQEVDMVLPCIDFAHLHARSGGKYNTREEWMEVLTKIEEALGRDALNNMHIHFSGIEYTGKGERRHLNLGDSDLNYREMVEVWREFDLRGVAISESPNIEGDAVLVKSLLEGGAN